MWEVVGGWALPDLTSGPGPLRAGGGKGQRGLLGADLSRGPDGRWRISTLLPGESSDPRAMAPLGRHRVGRYGQEDVMVARGRRPVDPDVGPGPLLVGHRGVRVGFTWRGGRSGAAPAVRRLTRWGSE